jgi:hypothetical protein
MLIANFCFKKTGIAFHAQGFCYDLVWETSVLMGA